MRTVEAGDLQIGDDHPPRIMGVVNLSPESPYKPSVFQNPAAGANYASELIENGADIIDIGLESANKRFDIRSAEWELGQLEVAIDLIDQVDPAAVFSIETRYSEVAERALDAGFDMVNDIAGFADPALPRICERRDAPVVKMAGPGDIDRPGALESVDAIYEALADHLTEQTIIDPAFGGWTEDKTLATDRETFRRLREFTALGRPMLVSINRKNFLKDIVGRSTEEALPASLAATSMAVERGADIIRTHDVAETRDAALIGHSFSPPEKLDDQVREINIQTVGELERFFDRFGRSVDVGSGVTHVFLLSDLTEQDRQRLRASITDTALLSATQGDRTILAGTANQFAVFTDEMDASLSDLTSPIRDAIDR